MFDSSDWWRKMVGKKCIGYRWLQTLRHYEQDQVPLAQWFETLIGGHASLAGLVSQVAWGVAMHLEAFVEGYLERGTMVPTTSPIKCVLAT